MITATPLRGLLSSSRCRDAVTLRRCHAAGVSSRLRDFATLRRCHAAWVSSRLRDAATLPRRWGAARVFASLRCRGAATLRRRWRGCSLLRSGAMLRRRERRCGGLLASSRLRNEILEPALRAQWDLSWKAQKGSTSARVEARGGRAINKDCWQRNA